MARMPQIPQPDISSRPGRGVGQAELPDSEAVASTFASAGKIAGDLGDQLQYAQDVHDKAMAKVQAVLDETTAYDALGKHQDAMRAASAQLQQQFINDPQKAVDAFREVSAQGADDATKNPDITNGAGLKLMPMLARKNNELNAGMQDWALRRSVQVAGNKLASAEDAATHGLDNIGTVGGLQLHVKNTAAMTGPMQKQLTPDADKAARDLVRAQVNGWVDQRSAVSPKAAMDVLTALKDPNSFVSKTLDGGDKVGETSDRARGIKLAEAAYEGGQKSAHFDLLVSHTKTLGGLTDLLASNDPKFPVAAFAKRQEVLQQMDAYAKNPWLDAKTKAAAAQEGQNMLSGIDAAQDAFRKQRGLAQNKADETVRAGLLQRNKNMLAHGSQVDTNTFYQHSLNLRHDNLKSFAAGNLSYQTYSAIENSMKMATAKRGVFEPNRTETFWQSGNARLDGLFKTGAYRNATDAQKSTADEEYISRLYDALKSGANVDNAQAQKLAQMSADYAVGK